VHDDLVPATFDPPLTFEGPGFRLEPLGPVHNERDYEAWTSSIDHIRASPGKWDEWPHQMTLQQNMADLTKHAREFANREGFTYSILDGDEVVGCLYIYPDRQGETDARVSSWVKESRAELDAVVRRSVTELLREDWPFRSVDYASRLAE
jgi:hypothetical protein